MPRALPMLLAVVLGAACAALVACGGNDAGAGLISSSRASAMVKELDRISAAVERGACSGVTDAVARLQDQVNRLSNQVDPKLRARLQEGVSNLADVAPRECLDRRVATQTTPTTTTPPETTPTTPPETTPTTPPETTTTAPPPTTPEPPTTPPATTPPEGSGGGATIPQNPGDTGGVQPTP